MKTLGKISVARLFTLLSGLFASLLAQVAPVAAQLKGTTSYRIALTPDAVFEGILEDVSKADAPAAVVGSVRIDKPGQIPIRIEIPDDAVRIDQSHSYAVRGRILVGQQLLFTTDHAYPVLTRGHSNEVQMMLRMVAASKSASKSAQAAPVGALPASFIGELPCADCPGIRYQLNLFPDRAFFSRMTYLGRSDDTNSDDIGSWVVSSDRSTIVLKGGRDAPAMFKIKGRQHVANVGR
jgi:copper homeostasis protein (lipoprotein)